MLKNNLTKGVCAVVFFLLCIVSVSAQVLGDANADGTIGITDALLTARYSSGLSAPGLDLVNADVDKNGQVSITDALLIAQYSAKIITSFPGQTTTEPVAAFTISNLTPASGETIIFDASNSYDADGTIVLFSWDFDDDTTATGTVVSHAFGVMDDYKVALTVTDNSGLTKKVSHRVFVGRPQGWTEETHSKSADGNYDVVLPEDRVPRMDIIISAADYQTMEANLRTLSMMSTENPVYVPATVKFNNHTWWHVGVRYKGQSTLFLPQQSGKHKYPFRLNFDKFEDTYPEINNQRFYGFDELRCGNNWFDSAFVRDKVCADILRAGGTPTARGAFYRIYVDTGNGPVYWGLYTVFEDHGDEMMKSQFEDSDGNLYKGQQATGADLTVFNQAGYEKKTNEDLDDWSDLQALVTALNAPRADAATWRAGLEAVFNVNSFLRWLAINTAIVNFDTYGWVTKNHYLYQDLADNGRLIYLPWDFNMSLSTEPMMGFPIPIPSLSHSEVGANWPLIRFLMDDPLYNGIYHQEMRTAMTGCFDEASVVAKIRRLHELIRPYVVGAEGESGIYTYLTNGATEFDQGLTRLLEHIRARHTAVANYLNALP